MLANLSLEEKEEILLNSIQDSGDSASSASKC